MSPLIPRLAASLAVLAAAAPLGACDEQEPFARAFQVTAPDQLIGGDVAMARVGDFVIENDKIRVAVLNKDSSPAPGVFGGTFVDADLQRPEAEYRNGQGLDQLAEVIPVANLLWPRPDSGEVTIVADGSDGGPAIVRVTGEAAFFLETLAVLRTVGAAFSSILDLRFETDYILEPGKSYVRLSTRLIREGVDETETLPLPSLTGPRPILDAILGNPGNNEKPGVMAGDFVFFGARNDIFGPGIGFDEEKPIFDALFEGRDTFTSPLSFDYMAAAGGVVSYGYFNLGDPGGAPPQVLAPIITSSSTGFVTAALSCDTGAQDDATCDRFTVWSYDRYFAVGAGDVASIADIVFEARGVPVGRISGVVRSDNGGALPKGRVFLFRDPDPNRDWPDIYAAVEQNYRDVGVPGLLNAIDADVGLDRVLDGDFSATMPPGTYLLVAQNEGRTATSPVSRVTIAEGRTAVVSPVVPSPAHVRYRVTDGQGRLMPAKLSFVAVDEAGARATNDGLRRPYMGEGRLGNGVRFMEASHTGDGEVEVEAGRYDLIVSRGPEYAIHTERLVVSPGQVVTISAALVREIDSAGWISGDFHLHAEGSFDSGMKFTERVKRVLVEGVDLAVATDHDILTDYGPAVRELGVQDQVQTAVGVEMSTLELGHYVAFPLKYDASIIPHHGAPDWTCLDGPGLISELTSRIEPGVRGVRIVAHPRDGIIGYISQVEIDAYDFSRSLGLLSSSNILLARTTCEFDAMEIFNGKRFDLVRTPTNAEVIVFNRCDGRIEAAESAAELDAACPELSQGGPLATCPEGERLFECKQRHRRRMAFLSVREILTRTPAEQLALWNHVPGADDEANCLPSNFPDAIDPVVGQAPCAFHVGTYDEWMRWLDAGLAVTLTGGSDSHGNAREPGYPRNYVPSGAARPGDIDVAAVAERIVEGRAKPTFGPFVETRVGAASEGDMAPVSGGTFELAVNVQTASWFGVDRVEVYVNGLLEHVAVLDHGPEVIVDFDEVITLPTPSKDGFVSVVALGTRDENLFGPVTFDVQFGELQLPRVAALALGANPVLAGLITALGVTLASPAVPDYFPVFPVAVTNAIFLDVDGDGAWTPSTEPPPLCQRACPFGEANADDLCRAGEVCLPTGDCGLEVDGMCTTGPPGTESRAPAFGP